ncbi:hypothetical protein [Maribellus sediminis]|uniref:hypothetical protein n=1 Tax=Maribellus sediminis TaxID=2696285 RepID=UPI00142F5441|nr:hypothetical protein [Maribellus sediminis]
MENKKLLKFLLKDLVEIEELFAEKGSAGFDAYELEFLQTRFKGAKQIIQMLEDKEGKNLNNSTPEEPEISAVEKEDVVEEVVAEIPAEAEVPQAVEVTEEISVEEEVEQIEEETETTTVIETTETVQVTMESEVVEEVAEEEIVAEEPATLTDETAPEVNDDLEMEDEPEETVGRTLGDSFLKGQSVNDLMANGNGSGKLENKLSNSPVDNLQRAIGINDRYLYIRELFSGDAEVFAKTVSELDNLNNIQEAVSYLQQNYKWKKNETSLKFVNLVKRRFPNG